MSLTLNFFKFKFIARLTGNKVGNRFDLKRRIFVLKLRNTRSNKKITGALFLLKVFGRTLRASLDLQIVVLAEHHLFLLENVRGVVS